MFNLLIIFFFPYWIFAQNTVLNTTEKMSNYNIVDVLPLGDNDLEVIVANEEYRLTNTINSYTVVTDQTLDHIFEDDLKSLASVNLKASMEVNISKIVDEHTNRFIEDGDFSVPNIFRALLIAYPSIVTKVQRMDNIYYPAPAIRIRNTIFYCKEGRFLPEEELENWEKFSSNTYYLYSKMIPDPSKRSEEDIALMRKQGSKSYRKQKKPSYYGFNATLYGMSSLKDTNTQIIKTRFLGKQVLVHKLGFKALKKVEQEIYNLSNSDPTVAKFLKEGDTVYSFFWRKIAGSQARSLHSYGIAVDVLQEGSTKAIYWLWRQNQKIDWITEPISVRWNPPDSVVKIFERYGFAWGGKWNFYDTMHFEYRPDILILNGYTVEFIR